MQHTFPIILGTARAGRKSENVAKFVQAQATLFGFESPLVDAADYVGVTASPAWRAMSATADGFIIVTPEYNHGYPGELKHLIDLAYDEYEHKPVGLCTVSAGGLGGTRVAENILPVLIALGMVPSRRTMYVSGVGKLFDEAGAMAADQHEKQAVNCVKLLTDLQWYADALTPARSATA